MKNLNPFCITVLFAWICLQAGCAPTTNQKDIQIKRMPGAIPHLIFACDLNTESAETLFSRPDVLKDLKDLRAEIALSLPDYDSGRAKIVRQLNQDDIPVTAWLVMPSKLGYYFNANNATQAPGRFSDFETWTSIYGLRWASVGLDIEPELTDFAVVQNGSKWKFLEKILWRSLSWERKRKALEARQIYDSLIRRIKKDGFSPQTYQLLFLSDERKAQSTILERVFGIVPVSGSMESLMVYSSFNHIGPGLVYSYGKEAQSLTIGSTGSSDDTAVNKKFNPLNWDEFSNDLICASHFTHIIGVYNLQGCVHQGFLSRLPSFDWNQTIIIPAQSINKVNHFRRVVGVIIWFISYWIYILIFFIMLISLLFRNWRKRRVKRKRLLL
jgi:hypothetical protein